MGLRFQKRIKIGRGARANLSKSGLGMSLGVPGFRAGISSKGKLYSSVGIPGSGLTFRKYYGTSRRRRRSAIGFGTIFGTAIIVAVIVGVFRGAIELVEKAPWTTAACLCGLVAVFLVTRKVWERSDPQDHLSESTDERLGTRIFGDLGQDEPNQQLGRPGHQILTGYPEILSPTAHYRRGVVIALAAIVGVVIGAAALGKFRGLGSKNGDIDAATMAYAPETQAARGAGYRRYKNARFGFSLLIPQSLRPTQAPEDGDGLPFVSPDGLAKLTASGTNQSAGNVAELLVQAVESASGNVTYKHMGTNWFVLSWQNDETGQVGYSKEFVGRECINKFEFLYPISQRSKYDPKLGQMIRSFRAGDLFSPK